MHSPHAVHETHGLVNLVIGSILSGEMYTLSPFLNDEATTPALVLIVNFCWEGGGSGGQEQDVTPLLQRRPLSTAHPRRSRTSCVVLPNTSSTVPICVLFSRYMPALKYGTFSALVLSHTISPSHS